MKIHDLVNHFSGQVSIPIDPNDVAQQVKDSGIKDVVNFVAVKINVRILKGALHSYVLTEGVYGQAVLYSDIYFADDLTRDWRRLVCCKELLHILDGSVSQAAKAEDVEDLISSLCQIGKAHDDPFTAHSLQAMNDHLMMYYAVAILFPKAARDLLLPYFKSNAIDIDYIARCVDLPTSVVMLVMSDGWPNLHSALAGKK